MVRISAVPPPIKLNKPNRFKKGQKGINPWAIIIYHNKHRISLLLSLKKSSTPNAREIFARQFAPNCLAAAAASSSAAMRVRPRPSAGVIVRAVEEQNWPLFVGWMGRVKKIRKRLVSYFIFR